MIIEKLNNFVSSTNRKRGIFWFLFSLTLCCVNDVLVKIISDKISSFEITFFKFFFSFITLLPFYFVKQEATSISMKIHIIRSIFLYLATILWFYSLNFVTIYDATIVGFSIPILILIISSFFLQEKITYIRILSTIIGFIGIIICFIDHNLTINFGLLYLLLGALMFSIVDVITKYYVHDSKIAMIFYSSLFGSLLSFIPAIYTWTNPNLIEFIYLFLIGVNGNLILYSLLKSYHEVDISFLGPLYYLEIFISVFFSILIFREYPSIYTFIGMGVITFSSFLLSKED